MKITVKLVSMDPFSPPGFNDAGVGVVDLADGATLDDLVTTLNLPQGMGDFYMTLLNESAVPIPERDGHALSDGDEVTVFPAIKGG